jgi:hypothetical protein
VKGGSIKTGIILRLDQEKQRITVLDSLDGKNIFLCSAYVPICSYIMYTVLNRPGISRLIVHELCGVPLKLAAHDLSFLHQVIALCNSGMPLGLAIQEVYDLLVWLCLEVNIPKKQAQKDLFLTKLLMILGMQTTRLSLCERCVYTIHQMSVDTFDTLALDLDCLTRLQAWIQQCMDEHVLVTGLSMAIKNHRIQ